MVQYHLVLSCDKLSKYTINPKVTTKVKQQRIMTNKPKKEIKWNHKTYSVNPNEHGKREEDEPRTSGKNTKEIATW